MEHAMKFRHEYKLSTHYPILIGRTQQIKDIRKTIRQICTKDFPVLISGEQGTGKDLIAQAIHYHSSRRRGSLVKINCGLLAEDFSVEGIFESQERLFTETKKDERGLFEIANGATLVFDEIDRLSLPLQIEFQRFLERKLSEKFEGIYDRIKNIRFVFTTKAAPNKEMQMGTLIKFLLHQLNMVHIELPPLRERKADIPLLARFIVKRFNSELKREGFNIPDEIVNLLPVYQWPGNVKELENVIRRAMVTRTWDFFTSSLNLTDMVN